MYAVEVWRESDDGSGAVSWSYEVVLCERIRLNTVGPDGVQVKFLGCDKWVENGAGEWVWPGLDEVGDVTGS